MPCALCMLVTPDDVRDDVARFAARFRWSGRHDPWLRRPRPGVVVQPWPHIAAPELGLCAGRPKVWVAGGAVVAPVLGRVWPEAIGQADRVGVAALAIVVEAAGVVPAGFGVLLCDATGRAAEVRITAHSRDLALACAARGSSSVLRTRAACERP